MGLGSARQYVMLRRLLASGGLTPEQRARVQEEMDEIRDGMLAHTEVPKVKTRRGLSEWWMYVLLILGFALIVWVIYVHATMRVPVASEVVVGARLYHYNPWRSKDYMTMDVTAVYEDGTVELSGAGLTGWMAGTETVPMSELTDGHHRSIYTEWTIR